MSHVERYYATLRAAYMKIRETLPRSTSNEDRLQLLVKSINDTIGPDGYVLRFLYLGHYPDQR